MCRGDLAFLCNNKALSETLEAWAFSAYPSMAPRDFDDVFSTDFIDILRTYAEEQAVYSMMATAFPAHLEEDEQEENQQDDDSDLWNVVHEREKDLSEQTFLDNVDVPGLPQDEAARRAGWRKLPQRVRVAVRRLHRQFGHVRNGVLTQILRPLGFLRSSSMQSGSTGAPSVKTPRVGDPAILCQCLRGTASITPSV